VVVSIFGDSDEDKRDYGYAFGAFKGTAYLALVMAGRGQLTPLDAKEFRCQMMDGIEIVPSNQLSADGRAAIEQMLGDIEMMASMKFKPGN
jgi:hypothetical protein